MPISGSVVAETAVSGRLNVTVEFCQAAGFSPATPNMVQLVFDKPYSQGGAQLIKMPAYPLASASPSSPKCSRFMFQMAPEQVLQHRGRRMFVHLYANGALLPNSPIEQNFTMPLTAPNSVTRLPVTPTGTTVVPSWPNPAPAIQRDVQVVAPIRVAQSVLAPLQPSLSPAVQAAAAALAPTPSSIKVNLPMTAATTVKVQESGSLLPTTSLTKGTVQLPVKSVLGTPAYLVAGAALVGLGWWWLFRRNGFTSVRVSSR